MAERRSLHPELDVEQKPWRDKKYKGKKSRLRGVLLPRHLKVENEKWKEIPGMEGWFSVSDYGRVRRNQRGLKGKIIGKKILRYNLDWTDQVIVRMIRPDTKVTTIRRVFVLVREAFLPNYPLGVVPEYRDGDHTNLSVDNILIPKEHWRYGKKLTHGRVANIKRLLLMGETISDIARKYNVNYQVIWKIHKGETWKHVKPADYLIQKRGKGET